MDITHEKPTALAVQQNALTALLADPERLKELPVDKLERMLDMQRAHAWRLTAKTEFRRCFRSTSKIADRAASRSGAASTTGKTASTLNTLPAAR